MQAEVVVVGRGLIGAAATRHLVDLGLDVVAIGPGEPRDWSRHAGVFSSHFDSGRITRLSGPDPVWSELAARSIPRYHGIADRSDISFHTPAGLVAVSDDLDLWLQSAAQHQASHEVLDSDDVYERFGIRLPSDLRALYEAAPAGHIDPRKLILAQNRIARLGGATILDEEVTSIRSESGGWTVRWQGGSLTAPSVLVAAGAFTNELLPEPLEFDRFARTIVLAETEPMDDLPSMIWVRDAPETRMYWVPPVVFPDGRRLLKIGGSVHPEQLLDGDLPLRRWFRSGGSEQEADALRAVLLEMLPDLKVLSWDRDPCVMTATVHGRPYLGAVAEGLYTAVGGNGSAAKSSDEIGRLVADLVAAGSWRELVLDEADFAPVFERTARRAVGEHLD